MEASLDQNFDSSLKPKTVAIVGVSGDPSRIGRQLLKYLLKFGYAGTIYPVNPNYKEIGGLKCYASVADVPGQADVAMIAIPGGAVINSLQECAGYGVESAMVKSACFAETGPEQREHRKKPRISLKP